MLFDRMRTLQENGFSVGIFAERNIWIGKGERERRGRCLTVVRRKLLNVRYIRLIEYGDLSARFLIFVKDFHIVLFHFLDYRFPNVVNHSK